MGAVINVLRTLRQGAKRTTSQRLKLLRPSVEDNSATGHRIMPAPVHDTKIGARIDRGVQVGNRIKICVQPNKGAENPRLRELANDNSHQNLAEAWVDTNDPVDDSTIDKVFDSLEENARSKGHS